MHLSVRWTMDMSEPMTHPLAPRSTKHLLCVDLALTFTLYWILWACHRDLLRHCRLCFLRRPFAAVGEFRDVEWPFTPRSLGVALLPEDGLELTEASSVRPTKNGAPHLQPILPQMGHIEE